MTRIVAAWAAVFAIFVVVFVANYSVLPFIDHRYRAVLFPGDALGATLTERFHAATGAPLRYVIGSMWDGGNLAHYSPDQPQVLIDGAPRRAPWIDLGDLRKKGAVVVWTQGDPRNLPASLATSRPGRSRRAIRSADAPRYGRGPCRLGDREAAVIRRAALITRATLSKISSICASLTISGGDSAMVSPVTRIKKTFVGEGALHRFVGAQARRAGARGEIDAGRQARRCGYRARRAGP